MKTDKEFKCVDFKHETQMQIYREIKNLTPEEEIEYFHRRAESSVFGKWWGKLYGRAAAAGGRNKEAKWPHHLSQRS